MTLIYQDTYAGPIVIKAVKRTKAQARHLRVDLLFPTPSRQVLHSRPYSAYSFARRYLDGSLGEGSQNIDTVP